MTKEDLQAEVSGRNWFHRIQLPFGIVTPGHRSGLAWKDYQLPERLDGKSILDVGAWDGQFSFDAEQRGASLVVAMDVWQKFDPGSNSDGLENLRLCHRALGSHICVLCQSVYDLDPSQGQFDLILLLEVLYHLQHPLLALQKLRPCLVQGGLLCLETWLDAEWLQEPAMVFYPGSELAGNATNWWGPNERCVVSMAGVAGFSKCTSVWSKQDDHFGGRGRRACFHLQ